MKNRSRCSVFCGVSLDGFIARKNDAFDFLEGPPGKKKPRGGDDHGYGAFIKDIDAIVLGRNTFEVVLGFGKWFYGDKKVVVLSRRKVDLTKARAMGANIEWMRGEPKAIVAALAKRGYRRLYIDGGATIQRFLKAGLIDRLIVSRLPVLIGQGIPLFGPLPKDLWLKHVATRTFPGGMVQSEYITRLRG